MSAQNEIRVERIGLATLYLADCMEVLPTLDRVDACITDPPYGIGRDKGMGGGGFDSTGKIRRRPRVYEGGWDDDAPDAELIDLIVSLADVSVMWGGNYLPLRRGGKWLVWNKEQVMPSYSDAELAWTNANGCSVNMFTLHCNKARVEMGFHPTQKPLALMKWCIEQAGNPQTILDPFAGSGTTGVAALEMGLKFIGIEREPKYFEIMCERIQRVVDAPPLFPFSCDTTGRGTQDSQACLLPLLNQIGEKV